jgi:hypothetical protein
MAANNRPKARSASKHPSDETPLGIDGFTTVGALREESRIAEEAADSFQAEEDFLKRSMDPTNVIWVTVGIPIGLFERVVAREFHGTEDPLGPLWRARRARSRVADRILEALRKDVVGPDSTEDLSLPDSAVAALSAVRGLGSMTDQIRCLRSPDPMRMAAALSLRNLKKEEGRGDA